MLPSHWPKWILIPIGLGLTLLTVLIGLVLEPAVQAITPKMEPTPQAVSFPPRLPYAAPLSDGCVECHTSESALRTAGADHPVIQNLLLPEDSPITLHGRLGCVTCHDGTGTTQDMDVAHEGLVADPSHPDHASTYCLPCHGDLASSYPEHQLKAPHERVLAGIREGTDVCSCSNCHGAIAHGVDPLTSHQTLAAAIDTCVACHEEESVSAQALSCAGCHVGPHAERTDCKTCHASTDIWSKVELASHPMELRGAHATLECYECHGKPNFGNIAGFSCSDCHEKPHDFGGDDCTQCHVDGAAWNTIDRAGIDHLAIWEDYRYHDDVACQGCHFQGYELSTACSSCHDLGQMAEETTATPEPSAVSEPTGEADGDEFTTLAGHITERLTDWAPTVSAEALYENLNDGDESNDPFILSVRSREHYELGHVPGAYNIPWREIADPVNLSRLPTDRQIVAYCYTGHAGQVAATILNILGYDVTNLKFGMMGWTDDAEVLATEPFVAAAGYPVESGANELAETDETPILETGETDVVAIARGRAQAVLTDWVPTISAGDVYENLSDGDATNDPFVLSVRSRGHYELGHVPGAYNIPWRDVARTENLEHLPANASIVDYCYTGHAGQVAATVLRLLDYDVTNLKFGMMGWTDDAEVLATEPFVAPAGYPVETAVNDFQ